MYSQRCIWCNRTVPLASFNTKAHSIPNNVGGIYICPDVCDTCNSYFGNNNGFYVSIEESIREAFELTRYTVFTNLKEKGKNRKYTRFKSVFFNHSSKNNTFTVRPRYNIKPFFQEKIAILFKRGLYKIFLEEYHRQTKDGFNDRYNLVREYARYGLGNPPVFYLKQNIPGLFVSDSEFFTPSIYFSEYQTEILKNFGIYEMRLFSHQFILPVTKLYSITIDNYFKARNNDKNNHIHTVIPINKFTDIDFTNSYAFPQ